MIEGNCVVMCKFCKWWGENPPKGTSAQRECRNPKLRIDNPYGAGVDDGYGVIQTGPYFGCIHGTPKQKVQSFWMGQKCFVCRKTCEDEAGLGWRLRTNPQAGPVEHFCPDCPAPSDARGAWQAEFPRREARPGDYFDRKEYWQLNPLSWQPISTAPKDGSLVLAWRKDWDKPTWVLWTLNHRTNTTFWNDSVERDCYEYKTNPPTHWFPVPPTP